MTRASRVARLEAAHAAYIALLLDGLTREQAVIALCMPPDGDGLLTLAVIRGERPVPPGDEAVYVAAREGARAWLDGRPHPTHAYAAPTAAARGMAWLRSEASDTA